MVYYSIAMVDSLHWSEMSKEYSWICTFRFLILWNILIDFNFKRVWEFCLSLFKFSLSHLLLIKACRDFVLYSTLNSTWKSTKKEHQQPKPHRLWPFCHSGKKWVLPVALAPTATSEGRDVELKGKNCDTLNTAHNLKCKSFIIHHNLIWALKKQ